MLPESTGMCSDHTSHCGLCQQSMWPAFCSDVHYFLERDKISVDDIICKQVLRDTVWIQNTVEMTLVTKKITGEGGLVQKTS